MTVSYYINQVFVCHMYFVCWKFCKNLFKPHHMYAEVYCGYVSRILSVSSDWPTELSTKSLLINVYFWKCILFTHALINIRGNW